MEKFLNQKPFCMAFHEVQSNLFRYLIDNYGKKETIDIINNISKETWSPLIKDLKENGLIAMENHIKDIMNLEEGKYSIERDNKKLICNVSECPAIRYMKKTGVKIFDNFCHFYTELVNNVIADKSGYKFLVKYDQNKGKCEQIFWKE